MKKLQSIQILLMLILISISNTGKAQTFKEISVSYMNESIAFPFTSYSEFHPGLEVGTTFWKNEKEHSVQQLNTYAGWFLHQHIENGFFLRGEYAYRLKVLKVFTLDLAGGAGYMHTFYPGTLYAINEGDGSLSSVKQTGRPHALFSAGIGLTYLNDSGIDPFIRQDLAIETPFANGILVMPHSLLKIGINIKL